MYVACMAFHAKVSDPVIGGTYMTLLNTVTNLGGNWPSTLALWLVDPLTFKECQGAPGQTCGSAEEAGVGIFLIPGVSYLVALNFLTRSYLVFSSVSERAARV